MSGAPKSIIKKAEQLGKALEQVCKLNNEIIDWVDRKGEDGYDFASSLDMDKPYEFDLDRLIEALNEIAG